MASMAGNVSAKYAAYERNNAIFFAWLKGQDEYKSMYDSKKESLTPSFHVSAFIAFCKQMRKTGKDANKRLTMSYSTVVGYKSALKHHLKTVANVGMDKAGERELADYLAGVKKRCEKEKQEAGAVTEEVPIPFTLYRKICLNFYEMGDLFAVAYLVLTWNLGCRTNNTENIKVGHLGWREDALTIDFGHGKGQQAGCEGEPRDTRLLYANPMMPEICPVLALGAFLASVSTPLDANSALFFGGQQAHRFHKLLKRALKSKDVEEHLRFLGLEASEIGAHSIRRGAGQYLSGGSPTFPSYAAVCSRMGWPMSVQERQLWRACSAADGYCGRVLCGLPYNTAEFAAYPPHKNTLLDLVHTRETFPCIQANERLEHVRQFCFFFSSSS